MAMVVDALVEAVISNVLDSVANLIKEKVNFILNAKDDLKELQRKLERLQKALKDEDRKPFFSNKRDKDLEGELKDVVYDAQDIIEEYQTKIVLVNKKEKGSTSRNKVHKPWIPLCACFKKHVSFPYQLDKEIMKINQRLDRIIKYKEIVDPLKTTPKESSGAPVSGEHGNPRETTHHMGSQPLVGREDDKEKVKKLLLDGSVESSVPREKHAGVSIISIVGQGGIGKTTLAKMVFDEVEEQFGERRLWVCVSERPNREGLLRKILREALKGSAGVIEGNPSLTDLTTQLKSELSRKKFLLVLDDIWDLGWWSDEVSAAIMGGSTGSKILITSRKVNVSLMMNASYMHKLPELTLDESWILFLKMASMEENELVSHHLEDIGKRIVKKCGGLPLVVRTVGSLMRTKKMKKEAWEAIENSGIWAWDMAASSSSCECGDIIPGLMLSYDDLPSNLKSCFVYCSIFPKDYEIERDELVMQWVAHGLIDKNNDNDVEVIANQYVDDLSRRCLIEETEWGRLKLHDSLHDLALYIGGSEYSDASATEHTRHLSLLDSDDPQVPSASGGENKLRTLLIDTPFLWATVACITNLKWLRVLSLQQCKVDELPNSIGHLSLLRYLDLSHSNVRKLPTSIGGLCNLHMMNLNYSHIEELPKEMGELCNLRFLGLEGTIHLSFVAEGLGKLSNLRTLERFLVCSDRKGTNGCNIKELKDLNKLKGKLSIEGLGITRKAPQLLKEKSGLISLELNFQMMGKDDKVASVSEQSSVLQALEPPLGLEELQICHYQGQMPFWSLQSNYGMLQKLSLEKCPSWEKVISVNSLKSLKVSECSALLEIGSMPALKSLHVFKCGSLEQVPDMRSLKSLALPDFDGLKILVNMSKGGSVEQVADMSVLKSLTIGESNGLTVLSNMPALEKLHVSKCGSLEHVADMPVLKRLTIKECNGLRMLGNMPALESLVVDGCDMLEKISDDMPALMVLTLCNLNILKQLPAPLLSLDRLEVENLPNWEGWPAAGLGEGTTSSMPCLRQAYFKHCPKMQTQGLIYAASKMAGHDRQTHIEYLGVWECPSAGLGWELLKQLPNLFDLSLDGTALDSTLPLPLPSEVSTFLPSLKWLELKDSNDGVKWGRVPEWVWGLFQLELLGLDGFTEEISLGGHWQCLQKLRRLNLRNFPKLKSLVDVNINIPQQNDVAATTTCATDSKQQIACLSRLIHLDVSDCPTLELPQELTNIDVISRY